jgi:orotidine-5'-phosphate decarboxylase
METAAVNAPTFTDTSNDAMNHLIVALDYPSADAALRLVDQLEGACRWFKVGMELYYAAGNAVIQRLLERDLKVFLDLKLHDIPNTVAAAVRSVGGTGASLLTIHAGGGGRMMRAAAAALPGGPELLAVTVLTSMDSAELAGVGVVGNTSADSLVEDQVLRLARLAQAAGISGLVCSAEEVAAVRKVMGPDARLVVPGIRPASGNGQDDQRRTATPAEAIARGASMLVVGRPITSAADPRAAVVAILEEIRGAS